MTDRQKEMCEYYLPHPRDPELGDDEYYVRDTAGRVRKVQIRDLLCHVDYTTYGVYEVATGRRIDSGFGNPFTGFRKGYLYDNREDCKEMTHDWVDDWEDLRELQEKEDNK